MREIKYVCVCISDHCENTELYAELKKHETSGVEVRGYECCGWCAPKHRVNVQEGDDVDGIIMYACKGCKIDDKTLHPLGEDPVTTLLGRNKTSL